MPDDVGTLRILNAQAGDLRITFRPDDPAAEKEKTGEMIRDLIRRGYALLVEDADGRYTRALDFDPEARAYVVQEIPTVEDTDAEAEAPARGKAPRKKARRKKIPATSAKAVAVGRSAGG